MRTLGFSPKQLAQALGISQNHLYGLIGRGEIRAVRLGQRWIIPRHELIRLGVLPREESEEATRDTRDTCDTR